MANQKRQNRRRKARRKARETRAAIRAVERGESIQAPPVRNLGVVALRQRGGAGSHGDARKQQNKTACRRFRRGDEE